MRFLKSYLTLLLLTAGLQSARPFTLIAPSAVPNNSLAWQVPDIGYNIPTYADIGGIANLGEEYRWNTPVIYYGADATFLDYFGSNGVAAVDSAFAILNRLTNFSTYSASLSEFPLESQRINYVAQQLHLFDVKSVSLFLILEELGLAECDRYIWTLRDRRTQPGLSCPFMIYGVIMRSFDPVTFQPSAYLNGVRYSYYIDEVCSSRTPLGTTVNFPVDPLAVEFSAVMADSGGSSLSIGGVLNYGDYVNGLSRDDVGGLRYLYGTNNMNTEAISDDSLLQVTNLLSQLLFTSNLTLFAQQSATTNIAGLQVLYPNLVVLSETNYFTNIWITNLTAYFTNYPFDPVGTPPHLAYQTNRTRSIQTYYQHTFGNVYMISNAAGVWKAVPLYSLPGPNSTRLVTIEDTSVSLTNNPWGPVGSTFVTTNVTSVNYLSNAVAGDFIVLPTNLCSLGIIGAQLTNVLTITNVLISATNTSSATNNVGTNAVAVPLTFTRTEIDYYLNHVFLYYPVTCVSNDVALREGIDHLTFVRANYDSLLGRFFQPITNIYHLVAVNQSRPVVQTLVRVAFQPDYLFVAADLNGSVANRSQTLPNFNVVNELPGLGGPGNIQPHMTITLNKVGPYLINFYSPFLADNGLTERTAVTNFVWGSFDGSTNAPIVYPSGTSIMNLADQAFFQVLTVAMPNGTVGVPYAAPALQAGGGSPPYTWSLVGGAPPGLELSGAGILSGTPAVAGTFPVMVGAADSAGRHTSGTIVITIHQ